MSGRSPWTHVAEAAAALAGAMGVGRFVYTPILPLMTAQAGLTPQAGANLATANYVGYLVGALAGTLAPGLARSRAAHHYSLLLLVATLAAMPFTHSTTGWLVLRLLTGVASAIVFVVAASSLLGHLRDPHLRGWGFSGVGAGIALSGLLVLVVRSVGDWRTAWWAAATLAAVLSAAAWRLRPEPSPSTSDERHSPARRWFSALFASYTLEGVGYIIAGTFLVAAIDQGSSGWLGGGAWVVVGLAAAPSAVLWTWLSRHRSLPDLLLAALLVQAVGIALPAAAGGVVAALIAAFLFGGTFIGITTIALATGSHLRFPRAVALLTAGYSVGQILGPLAVTPLLRNGYHQALVVAAVVVLMAATAATVLRVRFPQASCEDGRGERSVLGTGRR